MSRLAPVEDPSVGAPSQPRDGAEVLDRSVGISPVPLSHPVQMSGLEPGGKTDGPATTRLPGPSVSCASYSGGVTMRVSSSSQSAMPPSATYEDTPVAASTTWTFPSPA